MEIALLLIPSLLIAGGAFFFIQRAQKGAADARAEAGIAKTKNESAQQQVERLDAELRTKEEQLEAERSESKTQGARVAELETRLAEERKSAAEKLAVLDDAQRKLEDTFKALSSDALKSNNESFLALAGERFEKLSQGAKGELEKKEQAFGELIRPISTSLEKVDKKIHEIEADRKGAFGKLEQQISTLSENERLLREETGNLVHALRDPAIRGRWGELQLRRVVELAGMLEHCDFDQQQSVTTEEGRLRPDMIVRLPLDKMVVVDAKAPLDNYLRATEAEDEDARKNYLERYATNVRQHIDSLRRKGYSNQFDRAPEFVVMFLPGESFFSAALKSDPQLIEAGGRDVIVATPTTLIGLLRAIAYGWQERGLAKNAKEISELGRQLHKRLSDMGEHLSRLGRSLDNSVEAYNSAIGSIERRVLVSARKFEELGAKEANAELVELNPIDQNTRKIQAPELLALPAGDENGHETEPPA